MSDAQIWHYDLAVGESAHLVIPEGRQVEFVERYHEQENGDSWYAPPEFGIFFEHSITIHQTGPGRGKGHIAYRFVDPPPTTNCSHSDHPKP